MLSLLQLLLKLHPRIRQKCFQLTFVPYSPTTPSTLVQKCSPRPKKVGHGLGHPDQPHPHFNKYVGDLLGGSPPPSSSLKPNSPFINRSWILVISSKTWPNVISTQQVNICSFSWWKFWLFVIILYYIILSLFIELAVGLNEPGADQDEEGERGRQNTE